MLFNGMLNASLLSLPYLSMIFLWAMLSGKFFSVTTKRFLNKVSDFSIHFGEKSLICRDALVIYHEHFSLIGRALFYFIMGTARSLAYFSARRFETVLCILLVNGS